MYEDSVRVWLLSISNHTKHILDEFKHHRPASNYRCEYLLFATVLAILDRSQQSEAISHFSLDLRTRTRTLRELPSYNLQTAQNYRIYSPCNVEVAGDIVVKREITSFTTMKIGTIEKH